MDIDELKSKKSDMDVSRASYASKSDVNVNPSNSLIDNTKEAIIVLFKPSLAGSPSDACSNIKIEQDIIPNFIYHSSQIKGFASKVGADKLSYLVNHPDVLRIELDRKLHHWNKSHIKDSNKQSSANEIFEMILSKLSKKVKSKEKKKDRMDHMDRAVSTESEKHKEEKKIFWNIDSIRRPFSVISEAYLPVSLYILDTGISSTHPDIHVLSQNRKNFVKFENDEDNQGHGTHCAGVSCGLSKNKLLRTNSASATSASGVVSAASDDLVGVAPGVELHSIKVLDKNGNGNMSTVLAAIDYIIQEKLRNPTRLMVVNLSLGFNCETTDYNALDEAIDGAISLGIIFVVAAGNDGANASIYSPAHVERAITVAAYDENKNFPDFNNYGPSVDILAPGVNIYSAWKGQSYHYSTGTSMANPHVAAACCLLSLLYPNANPDEIKYFLLSLAKKNEIINIPAEKDTLNLSLYLPEEILLRCEELFRN